MKEKNPKSVAAGKKASGVRWSPRYDLLKELAKYFGDNKDKMDELQYKWKTPQLNDLLNAKKEQKIKNKLYDI